MKTGDIVGAQMAIIGYLYNGICLQFIGFQNL